MALAKNQKEAADHARQTAEKNIKAREAKVATEAAKLNDNDGRVASAEAELVKTQTEKSDLQSKLQANEAQILELQKYIEEMSKSPSNPNPGAPSVAELQAQLDDARKQLENAEHEKTFLTEKLQPGTREQMRGPEVMVQQRRGPTSRPSVRGTVLAVNQAYNFVVLNLGDIARDRSRMPKCWCCAIPLSSEKFVFRRLNLRPLLVIFLETAWRVAFRCNLVILSFMLSSS